MKPSNNNYSISLLSNLDKLDEFIQEFFESDDLDGTLPKEKPIMPQCPNDVLLGKDEFEYLGLISFCAWMDEEYNFCQIDGKNAFTIFKEHNGFPVLNPYEDSGELIDSEEELKNKIDNMRFQIACLICDKLQKFYKPSKPKQDNTNLPTSNLKNKFFYYK